MRARVARDLGRFIALSATTHKVAFAAHAAYSIGTRTNGAAAGSFIVWFRPTTQAAVNGRVFEIGNTTNRWAVIYSAASPGARLQVISVRASVTILSDEVPALVQLGKVSCLAATIDATSTRVYLNGVLVLTSTGDFRPDMAATADIAIGAYPFAAGNALSGDVGGEAYAYGRALSAGEIAGHYFNGEVPDGASSSWAARGWDGTTTIKLTGGAGNNGTATAVDGGALAESASATGVQGPPADQAAAAIAGSGSLVFRTTPSADQSPGAGSFTIAFDYTPGDGNTAQSHYVISQANTASNYATTGWLINQFSCDAYIYVKPSAGGGSQAISRLFELGRRARYCFVFDKPGLKVDAYRDGVFFASTAAFSNWGSIHAAPLTEFLPSFGGASAGELAKTLSRVRFSADRAWSAAEIAADARAEDVTSTHEWPISAADVGTSTLREVKQGRHATGGPTVQAGAGQQVEESAAALAIAPMGPIGVRPVGAGIQYIASTGNVGVAGDVSIAYSVRFDNGVNQSGPPRYFVIGGYPTGLLLCIESGTTNERRFSIYWGTDVGNWSTYAGSGTMHVVVSVVKATRKATLWVNGVNQGTVTISGAGPLADIAAQQVRYAGGDAASARGTFGRLRIYQRALGHADGVEFARGGEPVDPALAWDVTEGQGVAVRDHAGTNNGVFIGGAAIVWAHDL